MKIVALSPFESAKSSDILELLSRQRNALLILPGCSHNTPSPQQVQRVIGSGTHVFVEWQGDAPNQCAKKKGRTSTERPTPNIVTARSIAPMPKQVFFANPNRNDMDMLAAAMKRRTIRIRGNDFTFFLCGEIMAFNPDGSTKHRQGLEHGHVVNPVHSLMGHWNHLGAKLSALSSNSLAIHVANNCKNKHGLKTDVRVYKQGKEVAREERWRSTRCTWVEWEM